MKLGDFSQNLSKNILKQKCFGHYGLCCHGSQIVGG